MTQFLLMPSGAAVISATSFPEEWLQSVSLIPDTGGVILEGEDGTVLLPFDLVDHLIKTKTLLYLYHNAGEPLLAYDTFIEIERDLLIETVGGSKILARNLSS